MQDKILIIDDYEISRIINEIELESLKLPILKAENAYQAIEILTSTSGIRIVTLDMIMPDMSGLELLEVLRTPEVSSKMRKIGNDPEFFIITDDHSEDTFIKGFELGALHYFQKPIKKGDILQACRQFLTPKERFTGMGVLIIEDSDFERSMLVKILKPLGVSVFEAVNGTQALEIAQEKKDQINLIISDLYLDDENADTFLKKSRYYLNLSEIPMIIISIDAKPKTILKLYKCGATDYITKPYIIEELFSKVIVNLQNQYLKKITEQQLLEMQELMNLREKFLSTHSHDLRSPLNNILGCLTIFQKEEVLTNNALELIRNIESSSNYMLSIIDQLLKINRSKNIQKESFQNLNLSTIVNESISSIKFAAVIKGIEIFDEIAENVEIRGDRLSITRCVTNVISNAIKFTPTAGIIKISLIVDSETTCLEINDSGIGIAKNKLDKIFNEYTTYNFKGVRNDLGTGLGLSIVKKIMDSHDGVIKVDSQPSKGTTFKLLFKISQKKNVTRSF